MKRRSKIHHIAAALLGTFLFQLAAAQAPTIEEAREAIKLAAEDSRAKFSDMSFRQFREATFQEPFENGKYIVNGDTAIANEKQLREFYEKNVAAAPSISSDKTPEFAIATVGGLQAIWSTSQKRALTYCVSDTFGSRYHQVVAQMENATAAWEAVGDVDFIHLMSEDSDCNASNTGIVFDVRPVQVFGRYLARAFFPNEPRHDRNVLIDESSFQLDPNRRLQLVGILRHELGHTIGARHEHTRPEAGRCFEDENYVPLTDYDPFSVMHYPHCNGLGDWSLTLTHKDKNGVACVYGAATGFTVDTDICTNSLAPQVTVMRFDAKSVARNEKKRYGVQEVKPNSLFVASISGAGDNPGDPDLYVKFDGKPQVRLAYDCRPFLTGAEERCEMDVPPGVSIARVMVHGFTEGNYNLTISYVEP